MGKVKNLVLIILGFGLAIQPGYAADTKGFEPSAQRHLVQLYQSYFPQSYLQNIFHDPRLSRMEILVKRNIHTTETARDYTDFSSPYSMHLAKKFARKWRTTLKRADHKFKVDAEVVVAILLVETGFGSVMGRYPVINVFSSIITAYHDHSKQYPIPLGTDEETTYFLERLEQKAQWAQLELKALLTLSQKNHHSPYHYMGSYAGAFGLPQFLPSSYLKWGYDSDRNGHVNLFLFPDAIYSTANYLKEHGWQKGLDHKGNKNAVWEYNHSQPYVAAIMKIAKHLKIILYQSLQPTSIATNEEIYKPLTSP